MKSASFVLGLVVLSAAAPEAMARPRGTYVQVDPSLVKTRDPNAPRPAGVNSDIIFLNRCAGGCTVSPGGDNSRLNTSSIIGGTRFISEFEHSDADWDYIVSCVRDIYEPYAIEITDVDPGSSVPHFEAIVAGSPEEIGQDQGVGGVSPWASCDLINDAITYSFANVYNDPQEICITVAQETAHAFGLDHEFLCSDPMTYLSDCSNFKYFQDVDANCGEFSARQCNCFFSRPTQNSHEILLDLFGAGSPTPPSVAFVRPTPGQTVPPGFAIEVTAEDNVKVDHVEVFINGTKVTESNLRPFIFNAPADLPLGPVAIQVKAFDTRGNEGSATIDVTQDVPCTQDSCPAGDVCLSGGCVDGPTEPGGLGSTCTTGEECFAGLCGDDGEQKLCTAPCGSGCPDGFECVGQDTANPVCWPSEDKGGCAASTGGQTPWQFGLFGLAALLGLSLRRRR